MSSSRPRPRRPHEREFLEKFLGDHVEFCKWLHTHKEEVKNFDFDNLKDEELTTDVSKNYAHLLVCGFQSDITFVHRLISYSLEECMNVTLDCMSTHEICELFILSEKDNTLRDVFWAIFRAGSVGGPGKKKALVKLLMKHYDSLKVVVEFPVEIVNFLDNFLLEHREHMEEHFIQMLHELKEKFESEGAWHTKSPRWHETSKDMTKSPRWHEGMHTKSPRWHEGMHTKSPMRRSSSPMRRSSSPMRRSTMHHPNY